MFHLNKAAGADKPWPAARGDVSTDSTKSNIIDNYVLKGYGVQNKSLDRLYIGNRSAGLTRAYIQFAAMPTIPAGATITAATMTLHFTSGTNTAANASAYQVTGGEWASGTIQWSNKPAANTLLQSNISHNNVTGYVFSCLAAVQHWYDGDTTGQNENYGIMLRYYNESTADYNAVYSADYSDATKRPSLTISYTPPSSTLAVLEGETLALAVSRDASAITWTSSDTAIATVDSSGVVTGIKAGEVTIKAFVDGSEYQRYTVHVIIQDGVYRIRNNAGLHLGTYGGTTENTSVMLQSYSDSEPYKTCQLWKVTYLGDGYYSIRPMHKLNMGLHASGTTGSSVDIVSIGMNDSLSEVALINRWGIERSADGSGYYLNHIGTSSLGLKADGIIPSHGMGLTIEQNPGTEVFEWSFLPVTGLFLHDSNGDMVTASAHANAEVEMGGTYTLAQMGLRLTTNNVTPGWSTYGSVASVDALGNVSAHKRGVAEITVSATVGNTTTSFVIDVTSVETVYVKNYYDSTMSTEKLASISGAISFLNSVYKDKFNLRFVMVNNLIQYSGAIDRCDYGSESACVAGNGANCSNDIADHHKNIIRIRDELSPIEDNTIAIMWSNAWSWIYCTGRSASEHKQLENGVMALVIGHCNVVQVLSIDTYASVSQLGYSDVDIMSIILAHEVAHTLGMGEVYEPGDYTNPPHHYEEGFSGTEDCIMEVFSDITDRNFCRKVSSGEKSALCNTCVSILSGEIEEDVYEN